MTRYCDDEDKCKNVGHDCDHCTRNYDYEEKRFDCFSEKDEKRIVSEAQK